MVSTGFVYCRGVFDGIRGLPAPGSQYLDCVGLTLTLHSFTPLCCSEQTVALDHKEMMNWLCGVLEPELTLPGVDEHKLE